MKEEYVKCKYADDSQELRVCEKNWIFVTPKNCNECKERIE